MNDETKDETTEENGSGSSSSNNMEGILITHDVLEGIMDDSIMEMPKHIIIFGEKIKLLRTDLANGLCGLYSFDDKTITISKDLAPDLFLITLVHEVIHAIQFRIGLQNTQGIDALEFSADNIAVGLSEVFSFMFRSKKKRKKKGKPITQEVQVMDVVTEKKNQLKGSKRRGRGIE